MDDRWAYVSIKKSIFTTIFGIIGFLLILFVPFAVSGQLLMGFKVLPLFGDGSLISFEELFANTFYELIFKSTTTVFYTLYNVGIYVILSILLFDLIFGVILACTRSKTLRLICKILSTIFAAVLILYFALTLFAFIGQLIYAFQNIQYIKDILLDGGIFTILVLLIISGIGMVKQFTFFNKPYKNADFQEMGI